MKRATQVVALGFLLVVLLPAYVWAGGKVPLAASYSVAGQELAQNGIALRKFFFIKVYWGGLYLPKTSTAKVLGAPLDPVSVLQKDEPRVMLMHFLRDVDVENINDAWIDGLSANVEEQSEGLYAQFEKLCTYMEMMAKGDEMRFVYVPGDGTRVWVKGVEKGTFAGKEFADALLSTWIGPKPAPGQSFKAGVLGGKH